jgi:hypothetical protein
MSLYCGPISEKDRISRDEQDEQDKEKTKEFHEILCILCIPADLLFVLGVIRGLGPA